MNSVLKDIPDPQMDPVNSVSVMDSLKLVTQRLEYVLTVVTVPQEIVVKSVKLVLTEIHYSKFPASHALAHSLVNLDSFQQIVALVRN